MGTLNSSDYERILFDVVGNALPDNETIPVIVCGMAGSRQGWAEAPYVEVPCCTPGLSKATHVAGTNPRLNVWILPGIKQTMPEDVMRGEETQIAGYLADHALFSGLFCLPGTHSKWVTVNEGRVASFSTFMTGELFGLLSQQSVLRHSIEVGELRTETFCQTVRTVLDNPSEQAGGLFRIRAQTLLKMQHPLDAASQLSGLLIGSELAALNLGSYPDQKIVILGADKLATAYKLALGVLGRSSEQVPVETVTLRGLQLAYQSLKENLQ